MSVKINPYLNFDGTCEDAFNFYQKAFRIEQLTISRIANSSIPASDKEKNRILHASLHIGNGIFLYGSDILPSFGQTLIQGNANYIAITPNSKDEADRLFNELSEGGTIEMPLSEQFFGYFGSFKDKFGVQWMIHIE